MRWDKKHRENHKKACVEANRRPDRREKSRQLMKAIPHLKGPYSEDHCRNISEGLKRSPNLKRGEPWGTPFKKGNEPWNKNKKAPQISLSKMNHGVSKETRIKISNGLKGNEPWNKNLTKETDERVAKSAEKCKKPHNISDELREELSKRFFKVRSIKPNNQELFINSLLLEYTDWKYTGDGRKLIGGYNPDFINEEKKLIVEFFGTTWHCESHTGRGIEKEENRRINHFAKYGYKTLIIWDKELKDLDKLKAKIKNFIEKES